MSYLWDVRIEGVCLVKEGPFVNQLVQRVGRKVGVCIEVQTLDEGLRRSLQYLTSVEMFTKKAER